MGFLKKILIFSIIMLCSYCYKEPDNHIIPEQYTIPPTEKLIIEKSNRIGFDFFNYSLKKESSENNILVSPFGICFSFKSMMSVLDTDSRQKIKVFLGIPGMHDTSTYIGFNRLFSIFTEIDKSVIVKNEDNFVSANELKLSNAFLTLIEHNKNINYSVDPNAGFIPDQADLQERFDNNGFQLINKMEFSFRGKYQNRLERLPFYYSPDNSDFIDMVVSVANYNYYGDEALKAIEIPLGRGNFNLLVVIPKSGHSIDDLAWNFNSSMFKKIRSKFRARNIEAFVPRLNISTAQSYSSFFRNGSLRSCFTSNKKDLKGLVEGGNCYLSDYEQAISIQYIYTPKAVSDNTPQEIEGGKESFFIDRPFLFIIYERFSEGIIFIGKIMNP
jgi:serpin B